MDTFEEFWKVFPKHVGKLLAQYKWAKITNGGLDTRIYDKDTGLYVSVRLQASAKEVLEGAKRYRATQMDKETYKLKDDGRFTCHPATWLNQGRWMDDQPA